MDKRFHAVLRRLFRGRTQKKMRAVGKRESEPVALEGRRMAHHGFRRLVRRVAEQFSKAHSTHTGNVAKASSERTSRGLQAGDALQQFLLDRGVRPCAAGVPLGLALQPLTHCGRLGRQAALPERIMGDTTVSQGAGLEGLRPARALSAGWGQP